MRPAASRGRSARRPSLSRGRAHSRLFLQWGRERMSNGLAKARSQDTARRRAHPLRVWRPLAGPLGPRGARGPDGTPEPHVAALGPAPVQLRRRSSVPSSVRRGPSSPRAVSWGA